MRRVGKQDESRPSHADPAAVGRGAPAAVARPSDADRGGAAKESPVLPHPGYGAAPGVDRAWRGWNNPGARAEGRWRIQRPSAALSQSRPATRRTRSRGHPPALLGARAALARALLAVLVLEPAAFLGAGFTDLGTDPANGPGKVAASGHHPGSQRTNVCTIAQQLHAPAALRGVRLLQAGRQALLAGLHAAVAGVNALFVLLHVRVNNRHPDTPLSSIG